jgi:hypothetical protein
MSCFGKQVCKEKFENTKGLLLLLCTFSKIHRLQLHVHWYTKVFGNVKKSLYNQPKPYFFKRLLWSYFWIDFNKCYTKTFGIVYILIVYLLIMLLWVSPLERCLRHLKTIATVACKWCVPSASDVFLSKNYNSGGENLWGIRGGGIWFLFHGIWYKL